MNRFLRFAVVGGLGFVADGAMLTLLLATTPLDAFTARLLSIGFALAVTWQLNRHLTFGPSSRAVAFEGVRYGGVGVATSVVNYLVYAATLWLFPWIAPLAALVVGSAAALVFSYLGYARLVFDR